METMTESLPDIPTGSTIRQNSDGSWQYQRRNVGPWLPMPAPQQCLPWQTPLNLNSVSTHHNPMSNLSPTTQAAWDAFNDVAEKVGVFDDYGNALAAFLRVVADEVVPFEDEEIQGCWYEKRNPIRESILAIATELEAPLMTTTND
jgi:hypothetical protein